MTKFRTLILIGALVASGAFAANASPGSSGLKAATDGASAIVAINPQPLPPIDRERDGEDFDIGSLGASVEVAINPQPLPPIDRERDGEDFDISSLGAGVDVAINPQPLPPIDRDREQDFEDLG